MVVPTIGGLWNSPYLASLNSWQIGSASLTWTGYIPWGRDFKWSISNVSGSPTDVSFDSGSTWYRAYFSGSGSANYSTATLDRPFSASAGVTTWPLGVYQRNFKYLVIRQNNSSQKKFCILMAAAQDRTGGPTLYMRAYEDCASGRRPSSLQGLRLERRCLRLRRDRDIDKPIPEVIALPQHSDAHINIWRVLFCKRQHIFSSASC